MLVAGLGQRMRGGAPGTSELGCPVEPGPRLVSGDPGRRRGKRRCLTRRREPTHNGQAGGVHIAHRRSPPWPNAEGRVAPARRGPAARRSRRRARASPCFFQSIASSVRHQRAARQELPKPCLHLLSQRVHPGPGANHYVEFIDQTSPVEMEEVAPLDLLASRSCLEYQCTIWPAWSTESPGCNENPGAHPRRHTGAAQRCHAHDRARRRQGFETLRWPRATLPRHRRRDSP